MSACWADLKGILRVLVGIEISILQLWTPQSAHVSCQSLVSSSVDS